MKNDDHTISIIVPALNEEKTIGKAVGDILQVLAETAIVGEIIVINDGSSDSTPLIVQKMIQTHPCALRMINHPVCMGIGASFWDGVDAAISEFVCMFPADNENDPREVLRYFNLLKDVDMVVPFSFNANVRSRARNILSSIYRFIVNNTFFTSLNYTNGTTIYRKDVLQELKHRCMGFSYQTDMLIRLIKRGYLYAEVPYKLNVRENGKSKAISWSSLREVIRGYVDLFIDIYFRRTEERGVFNGSSATFRRYKEIGNVRTDT